MTTDVSAAQIPFAADVFTWPSDEPQLIGGRCSECAAVTFPRQPSCARCGSIGVEVHLLPRRGTLYSWTTQEFLPKEPYAGGETAETFKPFGVGLVELGDVVRVEARLTESDPARLQFDMPVELTLMPFRVEEDGTEVLTFAFRPVEAEGN
jgi:uncharacterized OB-fold protein